MSTEPRFARRVSARVKPDRVDDFISKVESDVYPKLKQLRGIRRLYLLRPTDSTNNEFVSLTLWDNKEASDEYAQSDVGREIWEAMREFTESEPTVTTYNVEVHDVNAEDLPPPETAREEVEKEISSSSSSQRRSSSRKTAGKRKKSPRKGRTSRSRKRSR